MKVDRNAWIAVSLAFVAGSLVGMVVGSHLRLHQPSALVVGAFSGLAAISISWLFKRILDNLVWERYSAWRRKQAGRKAAREFEEQAARTLRESKDGVWRFGGLSITGVRILVFRAAQAQAVQRRALSTTYNDNRRKLPVDLEALYSERLLRLRDEHQQRGQSYGNDDCYSLDSFRLYRQDQALGRPWHLELAFSPTNYATFAALNLDLDSPLLEHGTISIRDRFASKFAPQGFNPENLIGIPLHLRMGVNVVLFTKDSRWVLADRSQRLAIAPDDNTDQYSLHIVGEGMLRPNDEEPGIGAHCPNPFRTAERGVDDELALRPNDHYDPASFRLIGLFFGALVLGGLLGSKREQEGAREGVLCGALRCSAWCSRCSSGARLGAPGALAVLGLVLSMPLGARRVLRGSARELVEQRVRLAGKHRRARALVLGSLLDSKREQGALRWSQLCARSAWCVRAATEHPPVAREHLGAGTGCSGRDCEHRGVSPLAISY